jgi:hypothetical protein
MIAAFTESDVPYDQEPTICSACRLQAHLGETSSLHPFCLQTQDSMEGGNLEILDAILDAI